MLYAFVFSDVLQNFRIPEFTSLLELCECGCAKNAHKISSSERVSVLEFECSSCVEIILNRSLLTKAAYVLWAQANTYEELFDDLKKNSHKFEKFFAPDQSFCIRVQGLGKKRSIAYQVDKIDRLGFLPFAGQVDLKSPANTFHFLETFPAQSQSSKTDDVSLRSQIYFGRFIGKGQLELPHKYNLQKRVYIGNTTMDPQLALIQANLAKVTKGSLVLDPFAGTGGILLTAAHFGAFCVGAEINHNIVHGYGKSARMTEKYLSSHQNVLSNFSQYGLSERCLSIMIADASRPEFMRQTPIFDAIVTDPPYGLREKSSKLGKKNRKEHHALPSSEHAQHYPEKTKYQLSDVFSDLLNLAAVYLKIGGRLAYWFPVILDEYSPEVIPRHPCLELVANCQQVLNTTQARHLLVMEKRKEPQNEDCAYLLSDMHKKISFRNSVLRNNL